MILDWHADFDTAWQYDVFDAVTGDNLRDLRICYADDESSIIRRHLFDDQGRILVKDGEVIHAEERRSIVIRRKPVTELVQHRSGMVSVPKSDDR
jgi:hypothetical protein